MDDEIMIQLDHVPLTGRTARAAMDALIDSGRPRRIEARCAR